MILVLVLLVGTGMLADALLPAAGIGIIIMVIDELAYFIQES